MANWRVDEERDYNDFTWKISGVSSISHVVGYAVQSPPFVFGGTTWTMKMFPNGDAQQNEGYISVTIERSNTQGEVDCYMSYKDNSNEEIDLDYIDIPNSEKKVSIPRLMRNLKESSQNPDIVINDTLYLVLDLRMNTKSVNECSFPTKSDAETVGTTDGNENVVGEISQYYEGCKRLRYTVSDIPRGLSSDYNTESPHFSFLNAKWISKLWPYYRMQNSQNQNVEIVLERLESEIPVHHVELEIDFWRPYSPSKEMSTSFAPSQTQSPAFTFQLDDPNITILGFFITLKVLKTARVLLEPENKSVEEAPGLNALPEKVKQFYSKKELCDVTLDVNGTEFKAHRVILAAGSPVLASMFDHEMSERQSIYINVSDFDSEPFKFFLDYLYEGKVESVSFQNAVHLYKIADYYSVPDLKRLVLEQIKHNLDVENILDSVILADEYDDKELYATSQDFFNRNLRDIFQTAQWKTFLINNFNLANKLLIEMTSSITVN